MSQPLGAGLEEPRDRHGAFPRLADEQRARLRTVGEVRAVAPGDILFREGDAGYDFVVMESAAVAIVQGYGNENRVIAVHGRHRFLGEVNLLTGAPAYLTAVVRDAGEVILVPADRLRELLVHDAELSVLILRAFMSRRQILIDIGAGMMVAGAALRRLATLVVEGATADELFRAVAREVNQALDVSAVAVWRCEPDQSVTVIAALSGAAFPVDTRWPLDGASVVDSVLDSGRSARIDDHSTVSGTIADATREFGFRSVVGVPITVGGRVWGLITTATKGPSPLPRDTTDRLRDFTELVATAVYNMQARDDLRALADEQAALRRIATLVARGAEPQRVFDAICTEAQQLVGASSATLGELTADGFLVALAASSLRGTPPVPPGTKLSLGQGSVSSIVARTRAPAQFARYEEATGELGAYVRERGIRASVAAPILVAGEVWGTVIASRDSDEPFAAGDEDRVARFAELAATAISNTTARAELIASRARIVAAGDEARRRIERNLHDGVQQRLIALGLDLQVARTMLPTDRAAASEGIERVEREIESVLEELRELSRGLHPPMLSSRGLGASLRVLARRSPIGVELDVELDERPDAPVETAVYYVVSEALANAVKHSNATRIRVNVGQTENRQALCAMIVDDGVGGAAPTPGSGLTGIADRVVALGGRLRLESPPGQGTTVSIELPKRGLAETARATQPGEDHGQ
jgi:signal transduction histidine kinase/CRP-like cAMP-binding protein